MVNKDRVCVGKEMGVLAGNQTKRASHLHQRRSKFSGDHGASREAGEENEKGTV